MSLKTTGNDLLQKITLRKLYFTFKFCQKKIDICQKYIKFWENLVKINIMSKYPKKSEEKCSQNQRKTLYYNKLTLENYTLLSRIFKNRKIYAQNSSNFWKI